MKRVFPLSERFNKPKGRNLVAGIAEIRGRLKNLLKK